MTKEEFDAKLAKAEADKAWAQNMYKQIADLFKEADSKLPMPWCKSKAETKKHKTWEGIYERILTVCKQPDRLTGEYKSQIEQQKKAAQKAEEELRQKTEATELSKLKDKAVSYLLNKGFKVGVDFSVDTAISFANDVAYEDEVQKKIEYIQESGLISFCGDDNCENCGGWDGESTRCQCGTRRVGWTQGSFHSFETPEIYPEPY